MKKLFCLILALLFVLSLCGCTGDGNNTTLSESSSGARLFESQSTEIERTEPMNKPTEVSLTDESENRVSSDAPRILTGNSGADTQTGFAPLEKVTYTVPDPENSKGLSTKKIGHSHGPASGGKPHRTVVEFQKTFDKYGALTLDEKSEEKVLYLTFDCGWEYENLTSKVLDVLKEKNVPAAFFCTLDHIKKQPELIVRMIKEGHIVGNHSTTHPSFPSISRTKMKDEIEQTENYLRENFGYCAKFFRFPAGEYSESALDLVSSLGYVSVFWSVAYNDWNVKQVKGKDYAVKTVCERLHPGAVILLHSVSKDNAAALGEIIDKARADGYVFKSLTQYNAQL